jgi:hypothetical protein
VLVIHGVDGHAPYVGAIAKQFASAIKRLRRNYQFWFYSYPSGYPYPYSALILRRELDAIEKKVSPH